MHVTDFPHVKRMFVDAYARLVAMKLFALRAGDYMRSASREDRRYLLYNPMVKMKVTTQGEDVINLLWDVIAAKGFEKDTYFEQAAVDIRALPKLEGTVHVNIALIVKFMPNYFFAPAECPEVPRRDDAANDDFLFDQGPAQRSRQHSLPRLPPRLRLLRSAQRQGLRRAGRRLPRPARGGAARRVADEGHRLSARRGASSSPWWSTRSSCSRTRAIYAIDSDLVDQIFDCPGPRLLRVRLATPHQAEQHAGADGALPAPDRQADRRSAPLRRGLEGCPRPRRRLRDEPLRLRGASPREAG